MSSGKWRLLITSALFLLLSLKTSVYTTTTPGFITGLSITPGTYAAPSSNASATADLSSGRYNYVDLLHKSILFYEAQRSGKLPANNRIPWRGDSALNDHAPGGRDLTGGWYDAGDFVKFNFPMAFSTTTLLWGLIKFRDGYVAAGELNNAYDSVRWPLDYFIKCWDSENKEYWAQVGDPEIDHNYWGRPEEMTMDRPAFKVSTSSPGSDVTAETAAALAAATIVFSTLDPSYSATLLDKAKSLYDFAYKYRGKYSDAIVKARDAYGSQGFEDELCWGAAWLYKATGESSYLQKANEFSDANSNQFSWDDKINGCQLLLYEIAKKSNDSDNVDKYKTKIVNFVDKWMPGGSIAQTQCGLSWYSERGSLRYTANAALIALIAADDGIKTSAYTEWATKEINFMLGDNKKHRSYVVGFGTNPPVRPHHSSSSCPDLPNPCGTDQLNSPDPNPQTLYGALVGGPDRNENYEDVRKNDTQNEVACDYNAGFQSAIAGLVHLQKSGHLPAVSPPSGCSGLQN